jgi:hypothetical protein
MKKLQLNLTASASFILLLIFYACDTYKDVAPASDLKLTGKAVFVLSNGNTIIDVRGLVKTTQAVRVEITTQPSKGSLSEIQTGLVQYTTTAASGKDGFNISVFSAKENKLLVKDTVKIIIGKNASDAPASGTGIYPQNDSAYGVTGPTDIYVLKNDLITIDSSLIRLVVYRPQSNYPPYYGTAQVINNRIIRYTPGANFSQDKMLYKIYNAADTTQYGFATIYVSNTSNKACQFELQADSFAIPSRDSSIWANVLANDKITDQAGNASSVVSSLNFIGTPKYGTAAVIQNNSLSYTLNKNALKGITTDVVDTLTYTACSTACNKCSTAKVFMKITYSACQLEALPDLYEVKRDSSKSVSTELNILANDNGCGEILTSSNIQLKSKPVYGIFSVNANGRYAYELPPTGPKNITDSLSYSICVNNRCSTAAKVRIKIK